MASPFVAPRSGVAAGQTNAEAPELIPAELAPGRVGLGVTRWRQRAARRAIRTVPRPPQHLRDAPASDANFASVREFLVRVSGLLYLGGAALYLLQLLVLDWDAGLSWAPAALGGASLGLAALVLFAPRLWQS